MPRNHHNSRDCQRTDQWVLPMKLWRKMDHERPIVLQLLVSKFVSILECPNILIVFSVVRSDRLGFHRNKIACIVLHEKVIIALVSLSCMTAA